MNLSNITNNVIGLFQPDANLEVFLILKEREYQLKQFDMSFFQLTDIKGEPQAEVNGGKFTIAIAELPDEQLLYWVTNQWIKRDGEIVFRNKTTSAPLKISFKNAYCVNLQQTISNSIGVSTSFVISSEELYINDNLFDNGWYN